MLRIIQHKTEDQDQRSQDEARPYFARNAGFETAFGTNEYHHGQQNHSERNQHRREDGSGPGGGNQEEYIPGHQRLGPIQQQPEEDIVEDVPDGKAVDKPGKAGAETPGCQDADGNQHYHSGYLPEQLGNGQVYRDGGEGELKSARIEDLPHIDHHGALQETHGDGKGGDGDDESA